MKVNTKQLYQYYQQVNHIISTDSRKIEPGCLFIALKGPNFDGNQFAATALEKGAAFVVVDSSTYYQEEDDRYLFVSNGLEALQQLAIHHRKKLKAAIIGITGSNGKTTTKELINAVLSTEYPTFATVGNLNNHIGVPLSILSIDKKTQKAVIEMGANHIGEIKELCEIAQPNLGLITNIGKAHLEGFGSLKGVITAKGELFDYLEANEGKVFLNMNDNHIAKMGYFIQNAITYGNNSWFNIYGQIIDANPFLQIQWEPKQLGQKKSAPKLAPISIQTQLIGKYNFDNVLAAIAIGCYFDISPENIKQAIENYIPKNNRSQIIKKGSNTILLDAYNANPTSMQAALENLATTNAKQKVAILGDMFELGKASTKEHEQIIKRANDIDLKQLILVGNEFGKALNKSDKIPPHIQHFDTVEEAIKWHHTVTFEDTHILIKGSRGMRLESLLHTANKAH